MCLSTATSSAAVPTWRNSTKRVNWKSYWNKWINEWLCVHDSTAIIYMNYFKIPPLMSCIITTLFNILFHSTLIWIKWHKIHLKSCIFLSILNFIIVFVIGDGIQNIFQLYTIKHACVRLAVFAIERIRFVSCHSLYHMYEQPRESVYFITLFCVTDKKSRTSWVALKLCSFDRKLWNLFRFHFKPLTNCCKLFSKWAKFCEALHVRVH